MLAFAVAACSSGPSVEPPQPGDALAAGSGSTTRLELPPRQEVIVVVQAITNASHAPLEVEKLRAIPGEGVPEAMQIVRSAVLTDEDVVAPGTYVTFPPVVRAGKRCVRAGTRSPRGLVLETGDEPLIMIWLRTIADGAASVEGVRVTYEQGGTRYEQEIGNGGASVVVDGATPPRQPNSDEKACAHRTRVLPGAVSY